MGQIINIRDNDCPQCPEPKPVINVEPDLAFLTVAVELFGEAIAGEDFEKALKVVDLILVCGNRMGQFTLHKTHR